MNRNSERIFRRFCRSAVLRMLRSSSIIPGTLRSCQKGSCRDCLKNVLIADLPSAASPSSTKIRHTTSGKIAQFRYDKRYNACSLQLAAYSLQLIASYLRLSSIAFVKITFRLLQKGLPYFFQKDISSQALSCAHRIDDDIRPMGRNIRPQKHHQSGRALR